MHLTQLKVAGFKSFVEPTIIPFSSQLVGVVGPNGCGKSNIIDAVRWVMGGSSAKNLRGESMSDVIFNGSSERKALGQASVELVFDNHLGRLSGQFANYQEISIKRVVTRDGDSFYFLNGSRCRRRDITDIFLGTGAGARGYSIIGQDTISRLIEARPDELRVYLEEVAGVSKYKERRRETLQRINHTRENLARVADIRNELEKQLQRLERQAKAAERYKTLRQNERTCRAEILALKWQGFTKEQKVARCEINQLSLEKEQHQTKIAAIFKERTVLEDKLHQVQSTFQDVQSTFYQLNTEIARHEETIQQQQRDKQRLNSEHQTVVNEVEQAKVRLKQHNEIILPSDEAIEILQHKIQAVRQILQEQQLKLGNLEHQKSDWQLQWEQAQQQQQEVQQQAQALHVRLLHFEEQNQKIRLRLEKNVYEQSQIVMESLQAELTNLEIQKVDLMEQHNITSMRYQELVEKGTRLRNELSAIEQQTYQSHDKVQVLAKEHAALSASLSALLRNGKKTSEAYLQWEKQPRLAEVISVPHKWLRACELVLAENLQAIVLDSMETSLSQLNALQGYGATFLTQQEKPTGSSPTYPRLSDQFIGKIPQCMHDFEQIFAAENLTQALHWLPTLNPQQSIVTADGYWLGPGWLKIDGLTEETEATGLLMQQQALSKLTVKLHEAQVVTQELQEKRERVHQQMVENEQLYAKMQQLVTAHSDALRALEIKLNNKRRELEQLKYKFTSLQEEETELQQSLEELIEQKILLEQKYQVMKNSTEEQDRKLQEIKLAKNAWEDELAVMRRTTDNTKVELHQTELQYNQETLKIEQLRNTITWEQKNIDTLTLRLQGLEKSCHELIQPHEELCLTLHEKVLQQQQLKDELSTFRQHVEELQHQLMQQNLIGQKEEQQSAALHDKIQQVQLHEQGLAIRASSLLEALTELDKNVEDVLAGLSNEITLASREQALQELEEKINRLGAINLVAIEEFQEALERKQQLDFQYNDLIEALMTLENAISRMDKETFQRLKETFDQVNELFQTLFPRLFGGGRAFLELTCDNLLEAGILVMAQPPGKRNSTIHMLSGGEKAMTAVALVFAMFQLNPSPFCMLDEVDAPLDDLNVRRFCDLVKEISKFVQFLFVTHNKVTMELADQLIGVTMREPGVSQIVAVDVQQALAMAN